MGSALAGKSSSGAGKLMAMKQNTWSTPYYLMDESRLVHNLELLQAVSRRTGCKILLAQKAFSMYACYPLLRQYLQGTAASGLYEARLGCEHFGGETHVFSPAYKEQEFDGLLSYADHIIFNSPSQLRKFGARAKAAGKAVGLRVNPECSTQAGQTIYDPCAPGSRLGTTRANFDERLLSLLDGLHMHTLCEQDADALETTVKALLEKFGPFLPHLKWLNLGGGHHITRPGYDLPRLERIIDELQQRYDLTIYLEPGEAVVLNAGSLVAQVLEIVQNGMEIAILDTSAACHMPDVLEMPYRPPVRDSGQPGVHAYTYRLSGSTCLAGDIIGDYSFPYPLEEGSIIVLEDMALYTMVKTNTFNGMPLPAIIWRDKQGHCKLIKTFGYEDFKGRLS